MAEVNETKNVRPDDSVGQGEKKKSWFHYHPWDTDHWRWLVWYFQIFPWSSS